MNLHLCYFYIILLHFIMILHFVLSLGHLFVWLGEFQSHKSARLSMFHPLTLRPLCMEGGVSEPGEEVMNRSRSLGSSLMAGDHLNRLCGWLVLGLDILTTASWEHLPRAAVVLELHWPNCLAITIWNLSNSFSSLHLPNSASNTHFEEKCSHVS